MIHLLIYAVFCVVFARIQAKKIYHWVNWAEGKKIRHAINAVVHIASSVTSYLIYKEWLLVIASLLVARVFFDWSLTLWRGLPLNYTPAQPKSIIDKLEMVVFKKNGVLPKLIYLAGIVVILIVR